MEVGQYAMNRHLVYNSRSQGVLKSVLLPLAAVLHSMHPCQTATSEDPVGTEVVCGVESPNPEPQILNTKPETAGRFRVGLHAIHGRLTRNAPFSDGDE